MPLILFEIAFSECLSQSPLWGRVYSIFIRLIKFFTLINGRMCSQRNYPVCSSEPIICLCSGRRSASNLALTSWSLYYRMTCKQEIAPLIKHVYVNHPTLMHRCCKSVMYSTVELAGGSILLDHQPALVEVWWESPLEKEGRVMKKWLITATFGLLSHI